MPKKTDVPFRITRAAIALFSRQGYHGTSTRDIARLADVSEVTLYRYFEHKEDIFWAALDCCFDALKPRLTSLQANRGSLTPHAFLRKALNVLVDTATFSPELIRLIAIALLEMRGKAEDVCRGHISPFLALMSTYFQDNIEAGNMRNLNASISALAISLTVLGQPELSRLFDGCELSKMDRSDVVNAYSEFWIGALLPSEQERSQADPSAGIANLMPVEHLR